MLTAEILQSTSDQFGEMLGMIPHAPKVLRRPLVLGVCALQDLVHTTEMYTAPVGGGHGVDSDTLAAALGGAANAVGMKFYHLDHLHSATPPTPGLAVESHGAAVLLTPWDNVLLGVAPQVAWERGWVSLPRWGRARSTT